jgi:DNA-binding beta-propeller fold protein YncE
MRDLTSAALLTGVVVFAAAACSDNADGVTDPDPTSPAAVLAVDDVARTLSIHDSTFLVVEVVDVEAIPLEGVTVTFSGQGVAHSLSAATATTDAEGRAGITVMVAGEDGVIEVAAAVDGLDAVPFTLTIEYRFLAPQGLPRGLAWDGSSLWVVAGINVEQPVIYELDPADGSVLSSFNAPGTGHRDLAWDGEALWYSAHGTRTIYRLNRNGTVLRQFTAAGGAEGQPRGLAWDGTNLWHADAAGPERTIFRLSPVDGEVLEQFTSPVTLPVALEWDGSHLWVSQISEPGDLVRFDTSGNVVQTLPSPGGAESGLAWDGDHGYLWVADYSPQTSGEEEVLIRRIRVTLNP